MATHDLLYEGKAKKVWGTAEPHEVAMEFKDDATAQNGLKRGQILDKGRVNARVTALLFDYLGTEGLPTHFIRQLDERTLLVRRLGMIPLEVIVRNVVAGSLHARTGILEGTELSAPLVEIYYKNDALGDPLFNDEHVAMMDAASPEELSRMKDMARSVNRHLQSFFLARRLILVDFKLEFGKIGSELILGDEITPDTCRLWDADTKKKLDKDRFRQDLGGVEDAYHEVLRRVEL
jgi:phosphoribosylaminoimidazole-succinocarboxamide synthase